MEIDYKKILYWGRVITRDDKYFVVEKYDDLLGKVTLIPVHKRGHSEWETWEPFKKIDVHTVVEEFHPTNLHSIPPNSIKGLVQS